MDLRDGHDLLACVLAKEHRRRKKNYHDETDVAENMVLDEHEEYLAYISRYKHEWQEYEGFEEEGAVKSSPRSDFRDEGSGYRDTSTHGEDSGYFYGDEEYSSHDSESDLSSVDSRSMYTTEDDQQEPVSYRQHTSGGVVNNDEGVSYASGEISFATFSSENNNNEGRHSHILTLPPSKVPPPMNPEFYDVDDDNETLPSTTRTRANKYPDSASTTDDSHHHYDFEKEPEFDQNFSHSLHPTGTGEVEVEI